MPSLYGTVYENFNASIRPNYAATTNNAYVHFPIRILHFSFLSVSYEYKKKEKQDKNQKKKHTNKKEMWEKMV